MNTRLSFQSSQPMSCQRSDYVISEPIIVIYFSLLLAYGSRLRYITCSVSNLDDGCFLYAATRIGPTKTIQGGLKIGTFCTPYNFVKY